MVAPSLPRKWPRLVSEAIVQISAMVHLGLSTALDRAGNSKRRLIREAAEAERTRIEVLLLKEELRIKDARLAQLRPSQRPHYPPTERLAILALQQARHWSNAQVAIAFLITAPTIAAWKRRIDDPELVRTKTPINRLPELVGHVVRTLKLVVPNAGKRRIAQTLARAGIAVAASSVARILNKPAPPVPPSPGPAKTKPRTTPKLVARRVHQYWNVDLTTMPVLGGFQIPWLPWSLPPVWPFAIWVAVVMDRYSRAVVAHHFGLRPPSQEQICQLLTRAIGKAGSGPEAIITDQGVQFGEAYRAWCKTHGIEPRYGALQKSNSIALIERFFRTLKSECLRVALVALRPKAMEVEIATYLRWYHVHRPHQGLQGRAPVELWPGAEIDARPRVRKRKRKRHRVDVEIVPFEGRTHLPVVRLRRAA